MASLRACSRFKVSAPRRGRVQWFGCIRPATDSGRLKDRTCWRMTSGWNSGLDSSAICLASLCRHGKKPSIGGPERGRYKVDVGEQREEGWDQFRFFWHPFRVQIDFVSLPGVSSQAPQPPANFCQSFGLSCTRGLRRAPALDWSLLRITGGIVAGSSTPA